MLLVAGSRLDSYEIIAPLGADGMGEVYRARDTSLKRDVAIKVVSDYWSRDPESSPSLRTGGAGHCLSKPSQYRFDLSRWPVQRIAVHRNRIAAGRNPA
jgi:serine/threonine protein kinase